MKPLTIAIVVAVAGIAAGAGAAFVHSGIYDIAADTPHWSLTTAAIETLRERSIATRASGIDVPADLGEPERLRRGAGNYDAMCTGCHLKPGVENSEIRKGLYPQPPNLAAAADAPARDPREVAARQFWIVKHGLKMTAMPAWSKGGVDDATIWDMVALLQKLPALSPEEYGALVEASEGHTHAGADGGHEHGEAMPGHHDAPGAPPHHHEQETEHEHAH